MKEQKILIIDDNPQFLQSLMMIIEMNGFSGEVVYAKNGAEALNYLVYTDSDNCRTVRIPSLIFLDINMPKLGGFMTLQTIRDIKETKTIPVIMLTASIRTDDIENAIKFGANGYLVKPVNIEELIEQINLYVKKTEMD